MAWRKSNIDRAWLEKNGFFCQETFTDAAWKYLKVVFLAMLMVVIAATMPAYMHSDYLLGAIGEGMGPRIWNYACTLGMICFGFVVMCPRLRLVAETAHILLDSGYSVGTFMTGLLIGGFLVQTPAEFASHGLGWVLFCAVVIVVGISCCALMNYLMWYLSWLAKRETAFLNLLSGLGLRIRIPLGLILILLPITAFLTQGT